MTPKELEQTIRALMQQPLADAGLRAQLEQLAAAEISFSGLVYSVSTPDLDHDADHKEFDKFGSSGTI